MGARGGQGTRLLHGPTATTSVPWNQAGFQKLIEQGVRWAVDEQAQQAWDGLKMPALVFVDGFNVPNYEQRDPRRGTSCR